MHLRHRKLKRKYILKYRLCGVGRVWYDQAKYIKNYVYIYQDNVQSKSYVVATFVSSKHGYLQQKS
jgi:hypothetical protein